MNLSYPHCLKVNIPNNYNRSGLQLKAQVFQLPWIRYSQLSIDLILFLLKTN